MKDLLKILTLEPLKGKRSQITIIVMGLVNILAQLDILKLTPQDLENINKFLAWALAFFFAEKVSK